MKKEILDRLRKMRLSSMALEIICQEEENNGLLSFEERIEKIVNREWNARQEHKIKLLLKKSELKYKGAYIDGNAFHDITILQGTKEKLLSYDWIDEGHNVILSGPTGCGKSFMACALALGGIHRMYKVYYIKAGLLAEELIIANRDRKLKEKIECYNKYDILVIDDFGLMPLNEEVVRPLFELIDSREQSKSLIVASQLPFGSWYDLVKDATYADAILDRLMKYSYKLEMTGTSKRKL